MTSEPERVWRGYRYRQLPPGSPGWRDPRMWKDWCCMCNWWHWSSNEFDHKPMLCDSCFDEYTSSAV